MDADKLTVISRKIELLLRLSTSPVEAEAAAALAKVQELLETYNLDMLTVNSMAKKADNSREDTTLKGGLYKWQREMWSCVAKLNFCMHWSIKGLSKGSTYEHRVLGSKANVLGTRLMSEYLEQAVERITREAYANDPRQYFAKAAVAYREGMAERICARLRNRRYEQEQQAKTQRQAAQADGSATALTVLDIADAENDANLDALYGEGYSAKRRAERAENARKWQKMMDETAAEEAAFKRNFPEEWAKREADKKKRQEAENKKWERNARRRKGSFRWKSDEPRHSDFYKGYDRGNDVSLDRQVDKSDKKRLP